MMARNWQRLVSKRRVRNHGSIFFGSALVVITVGNSAL
jgi:hypothetical protein